MIKNSPHLPTTWVLVAGVALLSGLALGGCATKRAVTFQRLVADPDGAVRYPASSARPRFYIVVQADGKATLLDSLLGRLFRTESVPVKMKPFIQAMARQLTDGGAEVIAYRVTKDFEAADPFIDEIQPTAVIYLDLDRATLKNRTEKREWVATSQSKTDVTEKTLLEARLDYRLRLVAYPSRDVMITLSDQAGIEEERGDESSLPDTMLAALARQIALKAHPVRLTTLKRPLFAYSKDPRSMAAVDAARASRWEEAQSLWQTLVSSGAAHWQDAYGLGVALERSGQLAAAKESYQKARQLAMSARDTQGVQWKALLQEVSHQISFVDAPEKPVCPWFTLKISVLPFSNETNSVDGPVRIRKLVYEALQAGGYDVQRLDQTDEILLSHGFSQGDQLKRVDPTELAQWLKSDLVLKTHLIRFDRISLGVYFKRAVEGDMRVWDRDAKSEIWSEQESVVNQGALLLPNMKLAASLLLVQWSRDLMEQMLNQPLGAEALAYADQSLSGLPMKPPL